MFPPPVNPPPDKNSLFTVNLVNYLGFLDLFFGYLDSEEQAWLKKLRGEALKRRYILSHGFLRLMLGRLLAIEPERVRYTYNRYKKPLSSQRPELHFNMSHSGAYACYVFSHEAPVGVDIEKLNPDIAFDDMIGAIASPTEREVYEALPKDKRLAHFYRLWTLKEATLKAIGAGLMLDPQKITFSLKPTLHMTACDTSSVMLDPLKDQWSFFPIETIDGYTGALAINRKNAGSFVVQCV